MSTATPGLAEICPSDKQKFWQVFQEYLRELDTIIGGDPLPGQLYEHPFWEEFWRDPPIHDKFWIVVDGEKLGFILLRRVPAEEWAGMPAPTQITEFCVFRPFRCREIGSSVLRLLIDDFCRRGQILTWDCLKMNARAGKLYDRVVREYARHQQTGWTCRKTESEAEAGPTYRYVCLPGSTPSPTRGQA